MNEGPRSLAEKLAVAGAVAPVLRQRASKGRKVILTDANGKPVKEATDVDVAMGLLRRADIDFSVQPGERPKWVRCRLCGLPVEVKSMGIVRRRCIRKGSCVDCGRPLSPRSGDCQSGPRCIGVRRQLPAGPSWRP